MMLRGPTTSCSLLAVPRCWGSDLGRQHARCGVLYGDLAVLPNNGMRSTFLYELKEPVSPFIVQGVMQGISDALVFPLIVCASWVHICALIDSGSRPTVQVALPSQWFLRRRAFATGIVVAGSSIGMSDYQTLSQRLTRS